MSPDDGAEQFPRSTSPVQSNHPQYLNEPETSEGWSGDWLTAVADTQQDYADDDHHHIYTSVEQSSRVFIWASAKPCSLSLSYCTQ